MSELLSSLLSLAFLAQVLRITMPYALAAMGGSDVAHLIEDLDGERSALVSRIHHCIGDGIALISVMNSITDGGNDPLHFAAPAEHRIFFSGPLDTFCLCSYSLYILKNS